MIIILTSLLLFSGISVSTPLAGVLQRTWNILMSAVQLSSGEDGISVLGKSHMCSALSLKKEVVGGGDVVEVDDHFPHFATESCRSCVDSL